MIQIRWEIRTCNTQSIFLMKYRAYGIIVKLIVLEYSAVWDFLFAGSSASISGLNQRTKNLIFKNSTNFVLKICGQLAVAFYFWVLGFIWPFFQKQPPALLIWAIKIIEQSELWAQKFTMSVHSSLLEPLPIGPVFLRTSAITITSSAARR